MKRHLLPASLVLCTLIVALWLVMARQSSQAFKPFDLTAREFVGFEPSLPGWSGRSVPVSTNDPVEPNIAAFALETDPWQTNAPGTPRQAPLAIRVFTRLVHGYNMPMCMKIKGYTVVPIGDHRFPPASLAGHGARSTARSVASPSSLPVQIWRVTSSDGTTAIWATTMIRAGDFSPTAVDVCSMAFPRVDVADDPRWIPHGVAWSDLRHPWASLRQWGRVRWNASRTDLLTFLRLRRPAWASEELLTYVTCSLSPSVNGENEGHVQGAVMLSHAGMLEVLRQWRVTRTELH